MITTGKTRLPESREVLEIGTAGGGFGGDDDDNVDTSDQRAVA